MKKAVFFLLLISAIGVNAQTAKTATSVKSVKHEQKVDSLLSKIDTLFMINNQLLEHLEINSSLKGRYKLYQTDNIYTLLQLDTKTGMIEQVQWSLDSDNEGSVTINSDDLTYGFGYGSGSFELSMVPGLLSYTQPKTCISSYSLTKQAARNGMCNGV